MDRLWKALVLVRRVIAFVGRSRLDTEMAEEIRQHLEQRRQALEDEGMDSHEAARQARRAFGNPTLIHEESRDMWSFRPLTTITQDLRYGLRLMRRSPVFTIVSVVSLAVGIAATMVVTGIVNATLWRWSAMYDDPARLVYLWQTRGTELWTPTPADFRDWRTMAQSFSSVQAYTYRTLNASIGAEPEQLRAAAVTPGMFATIGVRPLTGAGFRGDEATWGWHRRVLLSETMWRRRFGSDPSVVGRTLTLNGEPHEILGVMPAGTWFTAAHPDVFVPFAFAPDDPSNNRNSHFIWVVARLGPDASFDTAAAEMRLVAQQQEAVHPANKGFGASPRLMSDQVLEDPSQTLAVLGGAVILVLLIASANVAGLLLVRTAARQRELAVRASLGASRGRVARQLLTEGAMLALIGGAAGVGLAMAAIRAVPALLPGDLPRITETGIPLDWRVLAVAAGAIMTCGVFVGLLPAITMGRSATGNTLKESVRTMSGGPRQRRLRSTLVSAEIALALMLVVGAALLVRSFDKLQSTELGTRTTNLITVRLPLG
ncbi:MAG: ABC transporter permease, partial [Acidobacteria bacterium]|nr:ABC transporter permease [Acidobacteriota bacterium]